MQSWNWGLGFAIPAAAMALAVVIFLSGHHKYKMKKPAGSPIVTAAGVSWHGLREYLGSFSFRACRGAAQDVGIQPNVCSTFSVPCDTGVPRHGNCVRFVQSCANSFVLVADQFSINTTEQESSCTYTSCCVVFSASEQLGFCAT